MQELSNPLSKFAVLFLLSFFCFHLNARAQTTEPDPQVLREMKAFVGKAEDALLLSRPRLVGSQQSVDEVFYKKTQFPAGEKPGHSDLERRAFEIINEQRKIKGLKPLEWSEDLARVARLHSENMAREKFFSHTGSDGALVNNRADRLGVSQWLAIGENIAFNRGFKKPVEMACQHWMDSTSHRENILNKKWRESAIGVAIAPDGAHYFTQVFMLK